MPAMTLDWKKARKLCTEAEFALVSAARAANLRSMTPRLVRLKVGRARGLRDKFRDLADRQAREAKGTVAPRGRRPARRNAPTVEKAELFAEVLRRFETRVAQLEASTNAAPPAKRRAARKPVRRVPAPTRRARAKRAAEATTAGAVASARRSAADPRKQAKLSGSHVPRLRGHVSSRNRRNQARRDATR
jgi:hypothetical protein